MIGRIYRLVDAKRIELKQRELQISKDTVIVRPEYMSICAADQRYYLGRRRPEIFKQKLPMALIHEATGIVLRDFGKHLQEGSRVVLVPLEAADDTEEPVKENYRIGSKFASSGEDGFMRDLIAIPFKRVIPIENSFDITYVFTELLSVALGAISGFEATKKTPADIFGVWGDGSMGFITSLALRCRYPDARIYVFGKNARKLSKFSFVTDTYFIDRIPQRIMVNHAFECVGDSGSESAYRQILEVISPQGTVSLLGVSEESVPISTRVILEKGLQLIGINRSDSNDFREAAGLIGSSETCRKYLRLLISDTIEIKTEDDIPHAFEQDLLNDFKTVIKWSL